MERRLTAILAADVVGYSRLMGANESGTLATLDTLRTDLVDPKISEHQGRIVKLTGDGMLVEFPSVVNAVACATDIQRSMRNRNAGVPPDQRIEFRMGVNVGDVIVQGEDIFGDGVNVAARLESIATPGGITTPTLFALRWLSPSTKKRMMREGNPARTSRRIISARPCTKNMTSHCSRSYGRRE